MFIAKPFKIIYSSSLTRFPKAKQAKSTLTSYFMFKMNLPDSLLSAVPVKGSTRQSAQLSKSINQVFTSHVSKLTKGAVHLLFTNKKDVF
jgi:hypothetical protein